MKFASLKPVKLLKSLLKKSALVQLRIDDEMKKKSPDWFRVIMLKKQRLIIKDAIYKLSRKPLGRTVKPS